MLRRLLLAAAALAIAIPGAAFAHHSFAAFFDPAKTVTIKGKVTAFRFTNPHGLLVIDAVDEQGKHVEWRSETNAPVVLMRRGWTRTSVKVGDRVTIDGWPARDGKPYLRLRSAKDAAGNPIGRGFFDKTDG